MIEARWAKSQWNSVVFDSQQNNCGGKDCYELH